MKFKRTFFIADTHFGDEKIIRYENRGFKNAEEMNETLINNWNSKVLEDDEVFVIGDFSSLSKEENTEILQKLNGTKILIMGNHDMNFSEKEFMQMGFESAIKYPILWNDFFILSHMPVYINANMPYANIFGHVHGSPQYRDCSSRSFCVSVERISYEPILWDEIIHMMKTNGSEENENKK